jgi:hypothetical protein
MEYLKRYQVVQAALDLFSSPSYLEIGVCSGATFHAVNAAYKVAVDPNFVFDLDSARNQNPHCLYYEVTSDYYFGHLASREQKFDVIYIDGLHTFEQTLRDLLNALSYLKKGGVVVIDDVKPDTYSASLRLQAEERLLKKTLAHEAIKESWMGDIYKLVFFIDVFMQQYSYRTVQENHGITVTWEETRSEINDHDCQMEWICGLQFKDTILHQSRYQWEPLSQITDRTNNTRSRLLPISEDGILPAHIATASG